MLEAVNITKIIKSANSIILKNVSCKFLDTGLYFICGKSGSGKSTLLNILSNIDHEYDGGVYFENKKIKKNSHVLDKSFSISFQNFNLIEELTVYENLLLQNIKLGIKTSKNIDELLDKFNLNNIKDKKISQISGGETQRVSIIRSLLKDPDIIFLDEPTGSVDSVNAEIIFEMLKELSLKKLVIVVSHDLELVNKYADFIYYLKDGEIQNKELFNLNCISSSEIKKVKKEKNVNKKEFSKIAGKIFTNAFHNVGIFITLMISFVISLALVLLNESFDILDNNIQNLYFNSNYYSISKKINVSENKNLSFVQVIRPEENELQSIVELNDCYVDISFDYIFNSCSLYIDNNEVFETVIFEPYFDPESQDFFCNECFNESIGKSNIEIKINFELNYNIEGETLTNFINKNYYFSNLNIKKDVHLINIPVIYYPYVKVKNDFAKIKCNENGGVTSNVYKYIKNSENNSDISSYKLVAFERNFNRLELSPESNEIYILENRVLDSWKSFKDLILSSCSFVLIFNIISYIGAFCVLGFSIFSRILFNKKNIAILKIIGFKDENILNSIRNEVLKPIIISIIFNIGLVIYFLSLVKYFLPIKINDYLNTNLFIIIAFIFIGFLIIIEFFFAVYKSYLQKVNIKKELNSQ